MTLSAHIRGLPSGFTYLSIVAAMPLMSSIAFLDSPTPMGDAHFTRCCLAAATLLFKTTPLPDTEITLKWLLTYPRKVSSKPMFRTHKDGDDREIGGAEEGGGCNSI
jgi:hypothetical protein